MVEIISRKYKLPTPYVGRGTFSNPTAVDAVRNILPSQDERPVTGFTDRQLLSQLQAGLTLLNQRRSRREITKKEFNTLRVPLKALYKKLMAQNINSSAKKVLDK